VTAVVLPDGLVAAYDPSSDSLPRTAPEKVLAQQIEERVADLLLVLEQLATLNESLEGRLDLDRIGVMGHSNGGIAAVEACRQDARFRACLNLVGQQAGGPFGAHPGTRAPAQPFYVRDEGDIPSPGDRPRVRGSGRGCVPGCYPRREPRSVFGWAFVPPTLLPFNRPAERVLSVARGFSLAFFGRHLLGAPLSVLAAVPAPTDVYVNVYPLGQNPPLPMP
jgi:hypothetical protein